MAKKFRLKKYEKYIKKSKGKINFGDEDITETYNRINKHYNKVGYIEYRRLVLLACNCSNKSILRKCMLKRTKRRREECKICTANI